MLENVNKPSVSAFASLGPRLKRRVRQRKQPVQARAQATTEALLEATFQVLRRHGAAGLTTTRVADRAGVSVGTLYQYFPDKQSLVMALEVRYLSLMVDAVTSALAESEALPLDVIFRRVLGALLQMKHAHLDLCLALREPLAESAGHDFHRAGRECFGALVMPHLRRALPRERQLERRAALAGAALDGAITAVLYESPAWLVEPWLLEELVALAVRYFAV